MIDPENRSTEFEYDALGRLSKKILPDGTLTYDYDARGNLPISLP